MKDLKHHHYCQILIYQLLKCLNDINEIDNLIYIIEEIKIIMSKAWISTKRQSSLRNLPVLR